MSLRPFIIDCDTGRDDALTLWVAAQTKLPLVTVVTSYGNSSLENVTDNTVRVLAFVYFSHIPVLAGLAKPLRDHKLYSSVVQTRQAASGNGMCNIELPASPRAASPPLPPEEMAQKIKALAGQHGPLDYFIIGPASNFAATAKALADRLPETIARITMMGGKLDPLWGQMPGADFNIASDPFAVRDIMQLGLPMRFLPMNATWPIYMNLPDIEALRATTPLAKKAQELMIAHCRYFAPEPVFRFHDPSILMAAQTPEFFVDTKLSIISDETSSDFGRLYEDENGHSCQIYQADAATQTLFKTSILQGLGFQKP